MILSLTRLFLISLKTLLSRYSQAILKDHALVISSSMGQSVSVTIKARNQQEAIWEQMGMPTLNNPAYRLGNLTSLCFLSWSIIVFIYILLIFVYMSVCLCVCVCVHACICVFKWSFQCMCIWKSKENIWCLAPFALFCRHSPIFWDGLCTQTAVFESRGFELAEPSPQPTVAVCLSFCLFVFIWKCTYMLPIACSLPMQAVGHIKLVSARLPIPSVSHLACHFLPVQPVSLYLLHFRELTSNNK